MTAEQTREAYLAVCHARDAVNAADEILRRAGCSYRIDAIASMLNARARDLAADLFELGAATEAGERVPAPPGTP